MKKGLVSILSGAVVMTVGIVFGAAVTKKTFTEENQKWKEMSDKHLALFLLMNQWVKAKQEGKKLSKFFEDYHFQNIAVYGMSYAGEALIDELRGSDIRVNYGIDKNTEGICSDIRIYSPEDELPVVDVVVVTAVTFFNDIKSKMREKVNCPIVSLENILSY